MSTASGLRWAAAAAALVLAGSSRGDALVLAVGLAVGSVVLAANLGRTAMEQRRR